MIDTSKSPFLIFKIGVGLVLHLTPDFNISKVVKKILFKKCLKVKCLYTWSFPREKPELYPIPYHITFKKHYTNHSFHDNQTMRVQSPYVRVQSPYDHTSTLSQKISLPLTTPELSRNNLRNPFLLLRLYHVDPTFFPRNTIQVEKLKWD